MSVARMIEGEAVDLATLDQQLEQHAFNIERIQRDAVVEIGRELKQAQQLFRFDRREGGFEGWLLSRLPNISRSAAYNAVQIFEGVGKYPELWTLSDAAKLQIASAEPDVKAIIAERVQAGEVFTAAQVKDLKREAAEQAIADLQSSAEAARSELAAQDAIAALTARRSGLLCPRCAPSNMRRGRRNS